MRWRRLCVDVDDGGNVLGASVELYDDTTADAKAVLVASGGEVRPLNPPQCCQYLYDNYGHQQYVLDPESFFPPEPY